MLSVILLALVAAAVGQKFCAPVQWEGFEFNYDVERLFRGGFNISYDATNTRVRVYAREAQGNRQGTFETIALYATKTVYEIDHTTNQCVKRPLTEAFQPDCLPSNATLSHTATIGITLNANIFTIGNYRSGFDADVVTTVANNAPVETVVYDTQIGLDHSSYWDVTTGIKNPAVFTPPSNCGTGAPLTSRIAQAARLRLNGYY